MSSSTTAKFMPASCLYSSELPICWFIVVEYSSDFESSESGCAVGASPFAVEPVLQASEKLISGNSSQIMAVAARHAGLMQAQKHTIKEEARAAKITIAA